MAHTSDVNLEAQLGRVLVEMAEAEPVTITNNGHIPMVLMSKKEYQRLKRRDRRVMTLDDFTEADITAIRNIRPSPESAAFNHEMKE